MKFFSWVKCREKYINGKIIADKLEFEAKIILKNTGQNHNLIEDIVISGFLYLYALTMSKNRKQSCINIEKNLQS